MSTTVYGGPPYDHFITTYFRTSFSVADPRLYSALTLQLRRDDGAVVYLNGLEVARSNMPGGPITHQTLASSTVGGADEGTFFSYAVPVGELSAGTNALAVEIHQRTTTSTDIGFDLSVEATVAGGPPPPTSAPTSTPTPTPTPTSAPSSTPTPAGTQLPTYVIVAAGDVASCSSGLAGAYATADLIMGMPDAQVLALGDLAYSSGTDIQFQTCYGPTWGQFKNRTHPSPGNHEYQTAGAAGYFNYFGVPEYYSWDFGGWHFVALNSEIDHSPTSAQLTWLHADLAADDARCTLAYWHRPRFSSGAVHGSNASYSSIWSVLQTYGVSVVLNGHVHNYERFGPQDMDGNAAADGIRQFVVGTGGVGFYGFIPTAVPNSQFRLTNVYGVLKLELLPTAYRWQFVASDGTVRDSGQANCN
jgi:alkaline phosphatase